MPESFSTAQAAHLFQPEASGPVLFVCEHASAHIPPAYDHLGLAPGDRLSHAAWDPGAAALTQALAQQFQSPAVLGTVSRLVYDCNRPPEAPSAMTPQSERIRVPGNENLSPQQRAARVAEVYDPFCQAVRSQITRHPPEAFVTVHSFTPIYHGTPREVEIGLLHDADTRLTDLMLTQAAQIAGPRKIERNAPYGPDDGVTHTLHLHALPRALPNVMIEVRNDLLTTPADIAQIATLLGTLLHPALTALANSPKGAHHA